MQVDPDILNEVIKKFPERVTVLTKLFHQDENFREVCEDYFLCNEAIKKIIITSTQKKEILKDYQTALQDLEWEILRYLNSETTINDK